MRRIAILGSCGAGKSTLAVSLGQKLDLPVFHLDAYFWQPGWQETSARQWLEIQQQLVKGDRWLIDGNYGSTLDVRLAAADTIIWLDFHRYLCLIRICKRYLKYSGKTRPDMAPACPEKLTREFIQYVWNFPQLHRPRIVAKLAQYQAKQIITLQNPRQVSNLLQLAPSTAS
ncbi:MAG: DNA topology modulation protein [Cyanobacteria bacterium J06635_13]